MAIAGKGGKIVVGSGTSSVVSVKSWSLELSLDTIETTALGDDWKKYITGLKEWTASAECDFAIDSDTSGQDALQDAYLAGTEVTLNLYVDSTHYYSGSAFVNSISVEDPVDDVVSASFEFTGNGTLTFS